MTMPSTKTVQASAARGGSAAGHQAQDGNAAPSERLLSPDQNKLLAQITGQLAKTTRAEKEAACQAVKESCEKEHSRKRKRLEEDYSRERKQLEDAARRDRDRLVRQHEAAMAEAVDMTRRRRRDSQQFKYCVRGHMTPELSGSIPRSIFEAEPDSVLNKMYNGEWAYAKDDQGRACINSHPAHWPLILNWLSFGSIPAKPGPSFIAECRYWQLDNLLAKIQEQSTTETEPTRSIITDKASLDVNLIQQDGRGGFQVQGKIHNFLQRFSSDEDTNACFEAFGAPWKLSVSASGAYLHNLSSLSFKNTEYTIGVGKGKDCLVLAERATKTFAPDEHAESAWGVRWSRLSTDQLQRYPYVDLSGSLQIFIKVLFQKP